MHDPRVKFALGLGYATSPTGADHMHNIHDTRYENDAVMQRLAMLGIHEKALAYNNPRPEESAACRLRDHMEHVHELHRAVHIYSLREAEHRGDGARGDGLGCEPVRTDEGGRAGPGDGSSVQHACRTHARVRISIILGLPSRWVRGRTRDRVFRRR